MESGLAAGLAAVKARVFPWCDHRFRSRPWISVLTAPLQAASVFLGALNVSPFFFLQIFSSEER